MSEVLRDIPMGAQGLRGRLLQVSVEGDARYWFVFYRGTCAAAKTAVAGCPVELLKELHERRQDVERRQAANADKGYALGQALDMPFADSEVKAVLHYLESTA